MLKPFYVDGNLFNGEMLEQMKKNGLSKANVLQRIHYQKWTVEEAANTKKGEKRAPRPPKPRKPLVNPANGPVKTYFLSEVELTELHKRVGKPGEHCKDYGDNKQPIALRGAWHG